MKLPQLSLRDLFWLVLVIVLVAGWCIRENQNAAAAQTREAELQELHGKLKLSETVVGIQQGSIEQLVQKLEEAGGYNDFLLKMGYRK